MYTFFFPWFLACQATQSSGEGRGCCLFASMRPPGLGGALTPRSQRPEHAVRLQLDAVRLQLDGPDGKTTLFWAKSLLRRSDLGPILWCWVGLRPLLICTKWEARASCAAGDRDSNCKCGFSIKGGCLTATFGMVYLQNAVSSWPNGLCLIIT